jgi:pimeloyl-ACP methyl ester carboxylesterase
MSSGEQSLVLLPGLHGSVRLFEPFVRALRALNPNRGFLPLPLPTEVAQEYPALAEWLVERLRGHGPLDLLAESFSVPLALHVAASPQVRVRRLVLAAGFCGAPQPLVFSLLPLRPLLALRPPKQAVRHLLTGEDSSDALVAAVQTEIQAARGKWLAARVRTALALRSVEVPAPAVPALLLQGRRDVIVPWEAQSELERHLPEATVVWIDAPHLVLQTAADECAAAVRAFLDPGVAPEGWGRQDPSGR